MTKLYTPRRAGKRWLEGAPGYVFDCFDSRGPGERYTVFIREHGAPRAERGETWLDFLGMSDAPSHPQGISMWGQMTAHGAMMYRYRNKHRRITWLGLPEHIRRHVEARCAEATQPFCAAAS